MMYHSEDSYQLKIKTFVLLLILTTGESSRGNNNGDQQNNIEQLHNIISNFGSRPHAFDFGDLSQSPTLETISPSPESKLDFDSNTHGIYQPYYICEGDDVGQRVSALLWHNSCRQSCMIEEEKHEVKIKTVEWADRGTVIDVYKISTMKVCYTSHENVFGYCTQSQSVYVRDVERSDVNLLPAEYTHPYASPQLATKTFSTAAEASCSYFEDMQNCGIEVKVEYRKGLIQKATKDAKFMMKIIQDGITVDPTLGWTAQGEVGWFWLDKEVQYAEACPWRSSLDVSCRFSTDSHVLECPEIGYTYVLTNITEKETCVGKVHDIDGPAPFIFLSETKKETLKQLEEQYKKDKTQREMALIQGVNKALKDLETAYCSSSCDLFSMSHLNNIDNVLDTPIGLWRLGEVSGVVNYYPCRITSDWEVQSPITFCGSSDKVVVKNKKNKDTRSWNTSRDYIVLKDTCGLVNGEKSIKKKMADGEDISLKFWNGDIWKMQPPYSSFVKQANDIVTKVNPNWFSKVAVTPDMIVKAEDFIDKFMYEMNSTKSELRINGTTRFQIVYSRLLSEMTGGIVDIWANIRSGFIWLFSSLPKIIALVVVIFLVGAILRFIVLLSAARKIKTAFTVVPAAESIMLGEKKVGFNTPTFPTLMKRRRSRSRSRRMSISDL